MKRYLRSLLQVGVGLVAGLLIAFGWHAAGSLAQAPAAAPAAPPGCQTFPQTGHTVCGRFLTYWQQHGGLAQQGYPLSEEFTETSDMNGRPYTVQYFERAVFEYHPENAGTAFEVLLSQLGTYLGKEDYQQGFPAQSGQVPFYERHDTGVQVLKSFYNAVDRKEYDRAYSYFEGAPSPPAATAPPYAQFVQGYADTVSVDLAVGTEVDGAAAGNRYASIPVVLTAKHPDGGVHRFTGCYFLHHTSPGVDPNPVATIWHIQSANLRVAANESLDLLLAQKCAP